MNSGRYILSQVLDLVDRKTLYEYMKAKAGDDITGPQLETLKRRTFYGREKDNAVYPIALANLVLHGIDEPHIWHGNSLSGVASYDGLFQGAPQFYDVVLMNPPFGGKEGKEAQTPYEYKTGATQVLFLQNVLKSMKKGSHCGIVLDEVVVLDNCDKRGRDEQLLMFQVAQWLQSSLRCLIVLPLRDITYDNHRNEPPLDTALKDLVFRIEPPNFQRVLHARVQLALKEMQKDEESQLLSYTLSNGIKVEYPSSQLGIFLASIMRSIYEHDAFIRRMVTGIAGRDIRLAIEIFLEFCTSGHIDEGEILKITTMKGQHPLPHFMVANILFRMNKRFYDGNISYVKNLFQCDPADPKPDHLRGLRFCIGCGQKCRSAGRTV